MIFQQKGTNSIVTGYRKCIQVKLFTTYLPIIVVSAFISNFIQIPIWTEGSICFQSGMEVTCGKDRLIFLQQVLTRLKESTIDVKGT